MVDIQEIQIELEKMSAVLDRIGIDYDLSGVPDEILKEIEEHYKLPVVYRAFLCSCNPASLDIRYGNRQILQFFPVDEWSETQQEHHRVIGDFGSSRLVLGIRNNEPFYLNLAESEDGDAPVYCQDEIEGEVKIASSFIQFLKILRINMEMLGPGGDQADVDVIGYENSTEDFSEFDEEADDIQYILEDYYNEIENIDPECVDAWAQP